MVERAGCPWACLIEEVATKLHRYLNAAEMKDDLHRWFVFYNFDRKNRLVNRLALYEAVYKRSAWGN